MRKFIKKFMNAILDNKYAIQLLCTAIYFYLRIVYATTKWEVNTQTGYNLENLRNSSKKIVLLWHNRLAIIPFVFMGNLKISALASTHQSGKLISEVLKKFGYGIVQGSSNRNSVAAARDVIKQLQKGCSVAITPDGPKGPRYSMNGKGILPIARVTNAEIVLVSANMSYYITINSWDKLILPLPFGKGVISVAPAGQQLDNEEEVYENIRDKLDHLSSIQPNQSRVAS